MRLTGSAILKISLSFVLVLMSGCFLTGMAQTHSLKSRVAVVANENQTNIWVSDFPKKTSVVITDSENNLLSIISTNDFGAAFLRLPVGIKTEVIAKTINGEIVVSNKAANNNKSDDGTVVSAEVKKTNKA